MIRRDLGAYTPDPDPPLLRLLAGFIVTRPGQVSFAIALIAGAIWSFRL